MERGIVSDRPVEERIRELIGNLERLPVESAPEIRGAAEEAHAHGEYMRNVITQLQESISMLRLNVKYLVFDLEATRRENAYLRKLLASQDGDRED